MFQLKNANKIVLNTLFVHGLIVIETITTTTE